MYTGRPFHYYMLDESICHFRSVGFILSLKTTLFLMEILFANNVDPDQTPHYVASDLSLHCLPMTLLRVSRRQRVKTHSPIFRIYFMKLFGKNKCFME